MEVKTISEGSYSHRDPRVSSNWSAELALYYVSTRKWTSRATPSGRSSPARRGRWRSLRQTSKLVNLVTFVCYYRIITTLSTCRRHRIEWSICKVDDHSCKRNKKFHSRVDHSWDRLSPILTTLNPCRGFFCIIGIQSWPCWGLCTNEAHNKCHRFEMEKLIHLNILTLQIVGENMHCCLSSTYLCSFCDVEGPSLSSDDSLMPTL